MWGTTARQHRNTPVRSTAITRRQSSIGYSQLGTVGPFTPALFTRTSMPPMAARVFRAAVSTASGSLTSIRSTCAAGWSVSGATSHATMRHPSLPIRSAMARPKPRAAPVITTTLSRIIRLRSVSGVDMNLSQNWISLHLPDRTELGRHENQWVAIMLGWSMTPDGDFGTGFRRRLTVRVLVAGDPQPGTSGRPRRRPLVVQRSAHPHPRHSPGNPRSPAPDGSTLRPSAAQAPASGIVGEHPRA